LIQPGRVDEALAVFLGIDAREVLQLRDNGAPSARGTRPRCPDYLLAWYRVKDVRQRFTRSFECSLAIAKVEIECEDLFVAVPVPWAKSGAHDFN
jgi:hypothetical protein